MISLSIQVKAGEELAKEAPGFNISKVILADRVIYTTNNTEEYTWHNVN